MLSVRFSILILGLVGLATAAPLQWTPACDSRSVAIFALQDSSMSDTSGLQSLLAMASKLDFNGTISSNGHLRRLELSGETRRAVALAEFNDKPQDGIDSDDSCFNLVAPFGDVKAIDLQSIALEQPKGDEAQDSLSAIAAVLNSSSFNKDETPIIVVFTDSPPHMYSEDAPEDTIESNPNVGVELASLPTTLTNDGCSARGYISPHKLARLVQIMKAMVIVISPHEAWENDAHEIGGLLFKDVKELEFNLSYILEDACISARRSAESRHLQAEASEEKKGFLWWHGLLIVAGVAVLCIIFAAMWECTSMGRRHQDEGSDEKIAPAPAAATPVGAAPPRPVGVSEVEATQITIGHPVGGGTPPPAGLHVAASPVPGVSPTVAAVQAMHPSEHRGLSDSLTAAPGVGTAQGGDPDLVKTDPHAAGGISKLKEKFNQP